MNVEIIRNTLYKAYLEDFYKFCKNLGGKTAEVMCEILAVRLQTVRAAANNERYFSLAVRSRSKSDHHHD